MFVPESEIFNFVQQGSTKHYAESARGAYQAFFDSNIQADFVQSMTSHSTLSCICHTRFI